MVKAAEASSVVDSQSDGGSQSVLSIAGIQNAVRLLMTNIFFVLGGCRDTQISVKTFGSLYSTHTLGSVE